MLINVRPAIIQNIAVFAFPQINGYLVCFFPEND